MNQTTLRKDIHLTGTGLHTGKSVTTTLRPAPEDHGIVFHVRNGDKAENIRLSPSAVTSTGLATTLSQNGVRVSTVEHLLAALRGLSIDNVHVDVDGIEVPIMDGSAREFVAAITKAGIVGQKAARQVLRITEPVSFGSDDKFIKAEPFHGFAVNYVIDFPHPAIRRQERFVNITPSTFAQVAGSRTFGFLKDIEALRAHGLALGGSLDNAIVLDESGVLNEGGLRHPDEFVRHKILDFVGDMGVFAYPIQGKFTVACSGHELNNKFARHLEEACLVNLVSEYSPEALMRKPSIFMPEVTPRLMSEALVVG